MFSHKERILAIFVIDTDLQEIKGTFGTTYVFFYVNRILPKVRLNWIRMGCNSFSCLFEYFRQKNLVINGGDFSQLEPFTVLIKLFMNVFLIFRHQKRFLMLNVLLCHIKNITTFLTTTTKPYLNTTTLTIRGIKPLLLATVSS